MAQHYERETAERRGEIVIVIAPPTENTRPSEEEIDTLLRASLRRVSVKDAVSEIVAATGLPKRDVYQRALALSKNDNETR